MNYLKKFLKKLINKNRKIIYSDRSFPLIDNAFEIDDLMQDQYFTKRKNNNVGDNIKI